MPLQVFVVPLRRREDGAFEADTATAWPTDPEGRYLGYRQVAATVRDDAHPLIASTFEYIVRAGYSHPLMIAVRVGVPLDTRGAPASPLFQELTATKVRDFPLAQWERSAAAHVSAWYTEARRELKAGSEIIGRIRPPDELTAADVESVVWGAEAAAEPDDADLVGEAGRGSTEGAVVPTPADYQRLGSDGVVDWLFPGLRDATGRAERRRYESLQRLADVAAAYEAYRLAGEPDPALRLAHDRKANPSTVRGWIHRARNAGLMN